MDMDGTRAAIQYWLLDPLGEVANRALGSSAVWGSLAGLGALLALAVVVPVLRGLHRRRDRWVVRDRYHQPLPSVQAARKHGIGPAAGERRIDVESRRPR